MSTAAIYRSKDGDELKKELLELLQEQFNLRMQAATAQLAHTHQFKRIRKDIARIKTVMTEKKRAKV